jgi:hypothetical protein
MKRIVALFIAACCAVPATAQQGAYPGARQSEGQPRPDRVESVLERCKAQRGVDCETSGGLNEWLLLERSRQEAVAAGSRQRIARPSPAAR